MRNAKGWTHTAYVRGAVYKADEKAVLYFTDMTEEELFDMKHDMGRRWVIVCGKGFGISEQDAVELWQEQEIMQIWNNEWKRMDHYQLVPILHKIPPGERVNVYEDIHLGIFVDGNPYKETLEKAIMKMAGCWLLAASIKSKSAIKTEAV